MQKTPVLVTNGSIEVSQLSYRYPGPSDEHCALLGVSFTVEPGEFVVLHGVSGSGKSTLLAILAGLLIPVEGVVQCAGVDLTTTDSDQRAHYRATRSAVVFQEFNLLSMLTVAENVGLPARLNGASSKNARAIALSALDVVGLAEYCDRFPGELSGGQRQRVSVARAISVPKPILLADEPTSALDKETAAIVYRALHRAADGGSSVVVATHDPALAAWGTRSVVISDGQLTGGMRAQSS